MDVKAAELIAKALRDLGNADAISPMGAIEGLAVKLNEPLSDIALAINRLAEAVENLKT